MSESVERTIERLRDCIDPPAARAVFEWAVRERRAGEFTDADFANIRAVWDEEWAERHRAFLLSVAEYGLAGPRPGCNWTGD